VSIKNTPVESSVEDAIEAGFSTLESLKEEISEGVENQRDHAGIAATSRFQTMELTVETLEEVVDGRPDWCASIDGDLSSQIRCSYRENRSRGVSRRERHGNAINALSAAVEGLREWVQRQEDLITAMNAEAEIPAEAAEEINGREEDDIQAQIDEANELADELEQSIGTAENAEFPGMRG
jgi:hypothetical protein